MQEIKDAIKRRVESVKRWWHLEPLTQTFVEPTKRTRRPADMSGRQWVKLRKKMGYAAKAR
jgi:hypothetical protein